MQRLNRGFLGAALLLALGTAPGAFATDYYIDQQHPLATDSNPGTAERPWATMYKAGQALLKPGDTVYVKPGRYDVSIGGDWDRPAVNPATSGTATAPITFRALPTHGAILDAAGRNPGFGSRGRHYITIDGFVMDNCGTKGLAVFGLDRTNKVRGVVLKNNIIRRVHNSITDNTDGIRLEDVADVVVRNNRIHDVHNATMDANAAGIKMYRVENGLFENNEIYDVATGIIDKQGGVNNTFRRNYIHNCVRVGIYLKTGPDQPARNLDVHENIIDRCDKSLLIEDENPLTVITGVKVRNNVFANYGDGGVTPQRNAAGEVRVWNNIFYRTTAPGVADFYTYSDPPAAVRLMDYNLFVTGAKFVVGRYRTNRTFTSLGAWSGATGFDSHSFVADPAFVDAAGANYRLAAGSPAVNAGTTTGTASGLPMNMGAYPTGTETVGLLSPKEPPRAPRLLSVQ